MLILLLIPFQAFLTVWGSSLIGHYTALRLWKEALLLLCIFGAIYLFAADKKIRYHTKSRRLVWLILTYIGLNLVWGLLAIIQHDVSLKALAYGLIVNLRFLAFFLVTWTVALRLARLRTHYQWLVTWPATVVVAFGLLQVFLLPTDFLRHFGYNASTIFPYETINHNLHYVRFTSTLRGANPLGAYLLIPISLLVVRLLGVKRNWRQATLLAGSVILLFYTFSRSAWIGAVISIAVILFLSLKSARAQQLSLIALAILVISAAGLGLGLRHNPSFENFVFHTQTHSRVATSSNQGHLAALKAGANDLIHDPLGDGPGTAGPASFYNQHKVRLAENYFIQVGQETGIIGFLLFVLINVGVGYLLWLRRSDPLALSLLASLIGITIINLLSHAWTDDTLAYVWWGLAGVAMAPLPIKKVDEKQKP
ncbi:MAG: hypothetical protein NVS1B10_06540 [Candidatus Saccharimonadales bacterium]